METSPLNLIALFPHWLWTQKQSPSRREYVRALSARSDVNLHLTGLGFPDWDNSYTAIDNVRRIMPECQAAYCYKLAGEERGHMREFRSLSDHLVTCEAYNECHSGFGISANSPLHPGGGTVVDECRKAGTRLVVCHHRNDFPRVEAVKQYGARLVHIPHGASNQFYEASKPWSERSGIILTGSLSRDHYPLRCRWKDLIDSGRIDGRYFRRPPNYTMNVSESDRLVYEYANALGACRVKLGCSSVWRYGLQHISEAALAGCAHVCDLPDDLPDYSKMMYAVDPNASDDVLVKAVERAMDSAQEIGELAQSVAKDNFTTAHYAERLVGVIREML